MRSRAFPLALSAALLTACTATVDDEPEEEAAAAQVEVSTPDEPLTLVADEDAVGSAVSTSRALFDSSDVAVLAAEDDRDGMLLGASAAVALGVPMLVTTGQEAPEAVGTELDRLGAETILAVGEAAGGVPQGGPEVVTVDADPAAVAEAIGTDLGEGDPVPADGDAAAVAALDAEQPVALRPDASSSEVEAGTEEDAEVLPAVDRPEPLADTVLLATGVPGSLPGIATARAAGVRVVLTGGATDPRVPAEVVEALGEVAPEAVVALGAGFAAEEGLDWKLATATTGVQLPGGGQTLFPGAMLVALYGHPETGALGLMGEQPLEAAVERAKAYAASYEPLVEATVVPTFEIIATVASASAGQDGDYSAEADPEFLRPWVEAAGEAGMYVVLDLQPGRESFLSQVEMYRSLLELPHVGLALDPEWRLGPNEVHLRQIGSVGIDEVNQVVNWLADLTRDNRLPEKLLVLHQFRVDMLPGLERLDTSRDELELMIHVDGQGGQGAKQATWRVLHDNAPDGVSWGWKNFIDEDIPMLTPEQTIEQVAPLPELVTYQ